MNNFQDRSAIIKGVIEKLSNDATGFAFEVDNGQDAEIHKYASSTAAIAALDSLLQNVVNRNPNQTKLVCAEHVTKFKQYFEVLELEICNCFQVLEFDLKLF